jgi:hypothetical protein
MRYVSASDAKQKLASILDAEVRVTSCIVHAQMRQAVLKLLVSSLCFATG